MWRSGKVVGRRMWRGVRARESFLFLDSMEIADFR
jgi:hypothetical protein